MAEHTPGPWHAANWHPGGTWANDLAVINPAAEGWDRMLAFLPDRGDGGRRQADARLIAAAPDLLAACEAQRAIIEHIPACALCSSGIPCATGRSLSVEARSLLDSSLAKARGEEGAP